jgi:multimeric flavodoxin WrbA
VERHSQPIAETRRFFVKILAIIGSPRGMQGNTGRLLEELLSGAAEAGAETEILSLKTMNVQPCVACDVCHKTGVCNIQDDYESIKEKLLACDGFILASPNYIFSVTAQMKALFDRCNGLIHCMALEGKYAAVVETSGGGEDNEVIAYMERFVTTLGANSVGGIGSPMDGIRTFPDETNLFDKARSLGGELCRCIAEKRSFPEQDAFIHGFKLRMSGLVDFMKEYWLFEREYWEKKRLR